MIVLLHETGRLELGEPDDFKAFSAVASFDRTQLDALAPAFGSALRFEGTEHVWVSQDWLGGALDLANRPDRREAWARMMAYARGRGWVEDAPAMVRAHVVWSGGA